MMILEINLALKWKVKDSMEHIGHVVRMSVSGYRGRQFEPRHQYIVSLSKTLYPH